MNLLLNMCLGPTSWWWRGTTGRTTGTWSPYSLPPTTATAVETRLPSWSWTTPSSIPSYSLTRLQGVGNLMWLVKPQTTSCKCSPNKPPQYPKQSLFPPPLATHQQRNLMQDISFFSSKDIKVQVLKLRFTYTLVKIRLIWYYGHFPGNKYYCFSPCQDLMLNEGIIGPQYTRMKDPEMCKMSCYSCSLKIFFCWNTFGWWWSSEGDQPSQALITHIKYNPRPCWFRIIQIVEFQFEIWKPYLFCSPWLGNLDFSAWWTRSYWFDGILTFRQSSDTWSIAILTLPI